MPRRPPEPDNRHGRTRRGSAHTAQRSQGASKRAAAATIILLAVTAFTLLEPGAAQDDVVMTATASLTRVIPIDDLIVDENSTPPQGGSLVPTEPPDPNTAGECRPLDVSADNANRLFRFEDPQAVRGCGAANYDFDVPPGATNFILLFNASRQIDGPDNALAEQTVQLALPDALGSGFAKHAVFDSTADDREMTPFLYYFDVPPGEERLRIVWYFEDIGTEAASIPAGKFSATAFTAVVAEPRIEWTNIELPGGVITERATTEDNETRTHTTRATIDIPDLQPTPDDDLTISIRVLTSDTIVGIESPQGVPLNLERIESTPEGSQLIIVFGNEILQNIGPGTYTFTFQRTETLPPPAAPPAPATIYPLVYLLSLLPAPTAAYAYTQVWRVRKVSEGGFGRAGGLYIGAAALTLGYLGLLAFLYFSGVLSGVATLPVAGIDPFVFAGFILLAVAFIALGALVARAVLHALQRDLDERRRIQRELERSNQELEHFAYVASHDLQEPLRTISGFSQLLHKRYGDELDERAVRYITRTVEGTDRMSRLINDLLEYSRVDSRGRPMEPTDLNKLLDEVKQDLETMIQDSGAKVSADHLPTVMADRTQVAQVLSNLIRNAIKYRHADRSPEVHVSSSQEDGSWVVSVTDNGMGIPEDQQERAFVIFQRLVPRETDDTGTGLGLAISRKIVERHGGRIWVESDGSTGSTFHFTLPRDPSTNGAITGPKAKAKVRGRRQRGNRAVT